jgi:L-asparaginase
MNKLQIFTTGGTIDKVYFDASSEFEVGEPTVEHILREAQVNFEFQVQSLMRKDSLEITDEDREIIRQAVAACACEHVLITHGTDTMARTAEALAGIPGKTIVLTGALSPARFRATDAVFNVGLAIGALHGAPHGAYLAMNGMIFKAGKVHKNTQTKRFEPDSEA